MAVPITSFLSKASTSIPFLLRDTDLRGGFRVVTSITDRDAIHTGARTRGMLVFVADDSAFFQWTGQDWEALDVTAMVSVGDGLTNNGETISIDQEHLATLFASVDHNHDEAYAGKEHNHDEAYATKEHTHTGFAESNHTHDDDYAPKEHTHTGFANENHDHDEAYAAKEHNHDEAYAAKEHSHTGFAAENHDHDEAYAAAQHDHDEAYAAVQHSHTFESLTEIPKVSAMPGVTVSTVEPGPDDGEDGDLWFVIAS